MFKRSVSQKGAKKTREAFRIAPPRQPGNQYCSHGKFICKLKNFWLAKHKMTIGIDIWHVMYFLASTHPYFRANVNKEKRVEWNVLSRRSKTFWLGFLIGNLSSVQQPNRLAHTQTHTCLLRHNQVLSLRVSCTVRGGVDICGPVSPHAMTINCAHMQQEAAQHGEELIQSHWHIFSHSRQLKLSVPIP